MGEITEMVLDGTLCQVCGGLIDEDSPGYPRTCTDCLRDVERPQHVSQVPKVACPTCGKKVKPTGLADHQRDVHRAARVEDEEIDLSIQTGSGLPLARTE